MSDSKALLEIWESVGTSDGVGGEVLFLGLKVAFLWWC